MKTSVTYEKYTPPIVCKLKSNAAMMDVCAPAHVDFKKILDTTSHIVLFGVEME